MHLMLDLETMGTTPDAVILSIGMQGFDYNPLPNRTFGHMHMFPPVGEQIAAGRSRDPGTLLWWSEQGLEAQLTLLAHRQEAERNGVTVAKVREDVQYMLETADTVWANGPDFDCVILRDFMGPDYKWPFWKHRDVRTLKSLFKSHLSDAQNQLAHDALSDCRSQIRMVQDIVQSLTNKGIELTL